MRRFWSGSWFRLSILYQTCTSSSYNRPMLPVSWPSINQLAERLLHGRRHRCPKADMRHSPSEVIHLDKKMTDGPALALLYCRHCSHELLGREPAIRGTPEPGLANEGGGPCRLGEGDGQQQQQQQQQQQRQRGRTSGRLSRLFAAIQPR